ncbi:MAG: dihydroorotate dehydrogenase, partial [Treponema sp.]|nr:dihydroorotate dehydrogenase [Treponema sp.]
MNNPLQTELCGIQFKNPVVLASGTCGFGKEPNEVFDIERLGGISSKGLTLHARAGNDGIRVWETPSGVLNSIGLENPGVAGFIEQHLDWLNSKDIVNIVNLGGYSIEDFVEGVTMLNSVYIDILELNISCPNIKSGGANFSTSADSAREVVRKVRAVCKHKLAVKLSPNAENIVALAKAVEEEGADAISMVNTILAMAIDIKNRKAVFNNIYAGLSGPAIKPIALRMVHQVAKAVSIPVMAMGGISNWQDAVEYIMAGATVIQIGTGSFIRPALALDVIDGLAQYAAKHGLGNIAEIRGII